MTDLLTNYEMPQSELSESPAVGRQGVAGVEGAAGGEQPLPPDPVVGHFSGVKALS